MYLFFFYKGIKIDFISAWDKNEFLFLFLTISHRFLLQLSPSNQTLPNISDEMSTKIIIIIINPQSIVLVKRKPF